MAFISYLWGSQPSATSSNQAMLDKYNSTEKHIGIPYLKEKLSDENINDIHQLITELANLTLWTLWPKQICENTRRIKALLRLGDNVDQIHPLNFLRVIFQNNELIQKVIKIYSDSSKCNFFIPPLISRLNKSKISDDDISHFCIEIGILSKEYEILDKEKYQLLTEIVSNTYSRKMKKTAKQWKMFVQSLIQQNIK